MTKKQRGNRPERIWQPGERIPMSFRVKPELRARMDAASAATGNSLMAEIELRLQQSFEIEDDYGGPRTAAVLRALADEKRAFYGGDDSWLEDSGKCRRIVRSWTRHLADLLPGMADVPAEIVLRLPMTPEAARAAEELYGRFAPPSWWGQAHKGFEAADGQADGAKALGPTDLPPPITVAEKIAAGRWLAAELTITIDPVRRAHLRDLLNHMGRVGDFPEAVRAEFMTAATAEAPDPAAMAAVDAELHERRQRREPLGRPATEPSIVAPTPAPETSVITARAAPEPEPGSIDFANVARGLWRTAEILLTEELDRPVTPLEVAERLLGEPGGAVMLYAIGLTSRPNSAADLVEYVEWLMHKHQAAPPRDTDAKAATEPPSRPPRTTRHRRAARDVRLP